MIEQGIEEGWQVGGAGEDIQVIRNLDAAEQHQGGEAVPVVGEEQGGDAGQSAVSMAGSNDIQLALRPLAAAQGLPPSKQLFVAKKRHGTCTIFM